MEMIRAYILRVIVCCIICAAAQKIVGKNEAHQRLVKMLAGMIILITTVSPLINLNGIRNFESFENYAAQAQEHVTEGMNLYRKELSERIVLQSEAYVLEKAGQMDVSIEVEILLSDEEIPAPAFARIKGNVSPFAKSRLMDLLENDLGISKEYQQWT